MNGRNLYALLLICLSVPSAFGKNHYFEHYFSKYHFHKSSSTTPSTTSTTEISSSELVKLPTQGDVTSEEQSSSEGKNENSDTVNITSQQSDSPNPYKSSNQEFTAAVISIVGSLIIFISVLGCIICCCPACCRGTKITGHIVERRIDVPQQPVIAQTAQQPTVVQHIPPEYMEEPVQPFAPQYQPPILAPPNYPQGYQYSPVQPQDPYSPVQPQMHYSPHHPGYQNAAMFQFYNPPEPPPPYELPEPK